MSNSFYATVANRASALPSDEDVAFYHEHGWFLTEKVLPDDLIEEALAGLEEHWSGHRDENLPVTSGYSDWMPGVITSTYRFRIIR